MLAVVVRSEINNKKNTLEETNWLEPGKDANSNCRGHGRVRSFWKTEGLAGQCLMLLQVTWPEPLHLSLGTSQEEHPSPCLPRSLQWPLGAVLCVVNTGSQAWAECCLSWAARSPAAWHCRRASWRHMLFSNSSATHLPGLLPEPIYTVGSDGGHSRVPL